MLNMIFDFYTSQSWHPFVLLAIYWAFWPGLMFATAHALEKRKVWLGKGQSRMFFPGDFMLGIAVVSFIGIHAKSKVYNFVYSDKYWAITAAVFFCLSLIIREIDTKRYPKRSKWSPTKLAHDFCGYFVCFWLIASLGIPQIVYTIGHPGSFKNAETEWYVFFGCAAFFIAMTGWDLTHPASFDDLMKMHPQDWGRKTTEEA